MEHIILSNMLKHLQKTISFSSSNMDSSQDCREPSLVHQILSRTDDTSGPVGHAAGQSVSMLLLGGGIKGLASCRVAAGISIVTRVPRRYLT